MGSSPRGDSARLVRKDWPYCIVHLTVSRISSIISGAFYLKPMILSLARPCDVFVLLKN